MIDKSRRFIGYIFEHARWCWTCIATGVCLYVYGATAWAQSGTAIAPDFTTWFTLLTGLIVALIGAYAKGLSSRITENRNDIRDLEDALQRHQLQVEREHHTKDEFQQAMDRLERTLVEKIIEIRVSNNAVHRRLDILHIPSAFPKD